MKCYETITRQIIRGLGIKKLYRGSEYIASSICFIAENEKSFTPITKILYPAIAKKYKTSPGCVEHAIRDAIELIWACEFNEDLRTLIFGSLKKRPTNSEFLIMLYNYINRITQIKINDFTYICPTSGCDCKFCSDIIIKMTSYLDE